MMEQSALKRGFHEIPHTADWAMKVWAEDLPSLFAEAAQGLNALTGARLAEGPRIKRSFAQWANDLESLLVAFLSELVYLQEQESLGFTDFDIELDDRHLSVEMQGARLDALDKPIKAVTYHDMRISHTERGIEVEVVFDV
jgi:SHS2 domain-containing protein